MMDRPTVLTYQMLQLAGPEPSIVGILHWVGTGPAPEHCSVKTVSCVCRYRGLYRIRSQMASDHKILDDLSLPSGWVVRVRQHPEALGCVHLYSRLQSLSASQATLFGIAEWNGDTLEAEGRECFEHALSARQGTLVSAAARGLPCRVSAPHLHRKDSMKLTPEEEMVRSYYLSRTSTGWGLLSFEVALVAVALPVFLFGFFRAEAGRALVFVGFMLCLLASARLLQSAASWHPHLRSLIHKYEAEPGGPGPDSGPAR